VTCWQEVDTALVRKEQEIDDGGCPVFESVCPKERLLESSYVILFSPWCSVKVFFL
jgi:hypothetical protein